MVQSLAIAASPFCAGQCASKSLAHVLLMADQSNCPFGIP
jgi:hypothetical protein